MTLADPEMQRGIPWRKRDACGKSNSSGGQCKRRRDEKPHSVVLRAALVVTSQARCSRELLITAAKADEWRATSQLLEVQKAIGWAPVPDHGMARENQVGARAPANKSFRFPWLQLP